MRIALVLLVVIWASCTEKNTESSAGDSLTFTLDSLQEKSCVGENCATLRLIWPVAQGGDPAEKINQSIRERLEMVIQTGEEPLPFDSAKVTYFRTFEQFKTDFPDSYGGWELEAEANLSYRSDSTLSIGVSWMSFLGGAHPNHGKDFLNFDSQTGDFLSRDRLILDEVALLAKVEQKFREFHQVAEGVSLADDGRFFLPETGFFLPNAMGFDEGKFWVIYIPYEIGPYAMGYTELEFSPAELNGMVRW